MDGQWIDGQMNGWMEGWMDTKSRQGATQTKINQATTTWTIDEEKKTNAKKNIYKKNYNKNV